MNTTKYYTFNVKKFRRDYELRHWIGTARHIFKQFVLPLGLSFVILDVLMAVGNLVIGLN
jgi:hypothetical protein